MARTLKNDLLLRAARRERTPRTPVWMMRQAGRFDPEYRRVRDAAEAPLEILFRTPDIATRISLLPRRLGVDAIIFYQDILTPLAPMGAEFVFRLGPVLEQPLRNEAAINRLRRYDPQARLPFVGATLEQIRRELGDELPLLGFAGAPFTLACFLIEGRSPGADPTHVRAAMRDNPRALHHLLEKLADVTVEYLAYQLACGADAVQLFESCADLLTAAEYDEFAHRYHVHVFERLATDAPTILFVKEQPFVERMVESGATVLSVGSCVDLATARTQYGDRVAFQGNVDNRVLVHGTPEQIDDAVRQCVLAGGHHGHILNLNHGILKETPFENGCRFIETAKRIVASPTSTHP